MRTLANLFKVLADENRLKMLFALSERSLCTCELSHFLKITEATVSSHLKQLRQAGLIDYKKEGKWAIYFLTRTVANENLFQYIDTLRNTPTIRESLLKSGVAELNREAICQSKRPH